MATPSQVQLGAILIPILGVLVASAINSVEEDDSGRYRAFVLSMTLLTIGPLTVTALRAIGSSYRNVSPAAIGFYATLSIGFSVVLIVGVAYKETFRGWDEDTNQTPMIVGLFIAVVLLVVIELLGP